MPGTSSHYCALHGICGWVGDALSTLVVCDVQCHCKCAKEMERTEKYDFNSNRN